MKATEQIISTLVSEFQKINNSHRYINRGGCGIFAEFAYRSLVKIGLKPKLAVITRQGMSKTEVKMNLRNNSGAYEIPFSHIVLVLDKKYIDSTGAYDDYKSITRLYEDHLCVVGMDIDHLSDWNADPYNWNNMFDRKQIPSIKKKIKEVEKILFISKTNL